MCECVSERARESGGGGGRGGREGGREYVCTDLTYLYMYMYIQCTVYNMHMHQLKLSKQAHPKRVLIEIWRLPFHHLNSHDPQRPDIHLGAILLPGDHLGGHPVWRAHHRRPLVLLRTDLSTEPKVG